MTGFLTLEPAGDGVLVVTMDRPERLNALTFAAFDEITALCRRLKHDETVRAVVLTGAGRAFCAGLDLDAVDALTRMGPTEFLRGQEAWSAAALAIQDLSTPVIAAVNGVAAGAGMSLALACDLRVASSTARFNAAFIRVGLTGGDLGSSYLLPRLVGVGRANEILMTGRFVAADEAHAIGLVNRIAEPDDLRAAALGLAGELIANSPLGVRLTKRAVQTNLGAATLAQAVELENRNQALTAGTADMREALAAFLQRRPARFGPPS